MTADVEVYCAWLRSSPVSAVLERSRGEAGAGVPAGCIPEGSRRPGASCALGAG